MDAAADVYAQIWLSETSKWKSVIVHYIKQADTHILSFQYKGFQILSLFDWTAPEVYSELRRAV